MKKVLGFMAGLLLIGANLYAGNGDLIVNGKVGIGTTAAPTAKLEVTGDIKADRISVNGYRSSARLYSVNTATSAVLLDYDGNALPLERAYMIRAHVEGTSTPTGVVAVIYNDITGTRYINKVYEAGNSSNNVEIYLDANVPKVRLYGHTGIYFVRVHLDETNSVGVIRGNAGFLQSPEIYTRASNVGIGTTSPDPIYKLTVVGSALASGGIWQNSDIRLKKNILPVDGALDKILKLNGVSYEWKHGKDFEGETSEAFKTDEDGNIKDDKYRDLPEGRTVGVIAQELEKVLPEAVNTGEDGIKAVSYTKVIPVLIEAMKEQQKQITDQQKRIEELEKKVAQVQ